MTIHILPPEVASKIAAGEVVERPANVVKELIENSLDAGATDIRVEAREGGRRLLRIIDNGHGIPAAELPLAFARHATSKLRTVDDLNHIATFGFRGEALYSIGAVSQVTLTSRHAASPTAPACAGGRPAPRARARRGAGGHGRSTSNTSFSTCRRARNFCAPPPPNPGRLPPVLQHYALAYPERRFSFVNEGRLVFQSTGSGDLLDVLVR
jgi:DNA mismatch repair protein MutL